MKRKRIILLIFIFGIIESVAIIYAVWPIVFGEKISRPPEIRLGIIPDINKEYSRNEWNAFLDIFKKEQSFRIVPYFANSHEEAVKGFLAGALDMIYINPGVMIDLVRENKVVPLVYRRYPDQDRDKNRTLLVARGDIKYLSQTKGLRLVFTDKYSTTGYLVPECFLKEHFKPLPLDKWFSEISFSGSEFQSFRKLINNEADLIAVNSINLEDYRKVVEGGGKTEFSPVWISILLPESAICISPASKYFKDKALLKKFQDVLWMDSKQVHHKPVYLTRNIITLEPVDYNYTEKLENLKNFLENPIKAMHNKTDNKLQ